MGSVPIPRRRRRRVLAAIASFAALAGATAFYGVPGARAVTGFVAKVVCSGVFVAGRDPADLLREDVGFVTLCGLVKAEVDRGARTVTARLGPIEAQAVDRGALGAALAIGATVAELRAGRVEETHPEGDLGGAAGGDARAPWPLGDANPPGPPPSGLDGARLAAALDRAFAEPDPDRPRRTRAVLVVWRGRIVAERYAPGFGPRTRLLGWSMTKSWIGALTGIRVAEGGLQLSDPAGLPEWSAPGDPRRAITVEHLLRMSSGLRFEERYESPRADAVRMLFVSGDTAGYAARLPLERPLGTRWEYSSGTTNILSAVLRRSFGGDDAAYRAFPRKALFEPLGMRSAIIEADASGTLVGSSFGYATARDWARFGLCYLGDGVFAGRRVLPEGWVAYTRTPAPAAPRGEYGAHFWLNAGAQGEPAKRLMPKLPADLYFAAGFQEQYVTIVPSREAVIVRLGSTDRPWWWKQADFLADVLGALPE